MELTDKTVKVLKVQTSDIVNALKNSGEKLEWDMYWDYSDEINEKTFIECFIGDKYEKSYYDLRDKEHYTPKELADEIRTRLSDRIWDWNIEFISDDVRNRSLEIFKDYLRKEKEEKGLIYQEIDYDDVDRCEIEECRNINLDMDYILGRSYVVWNLEWFSNYDGIDENEKYEDGQCIKDLVDNFKRIDKEKLEQAAAEWIYSGSDLKYNYKSSMLDLLKIIEKWGMEPRGDAVLHQWFNGSGSQEFEMPWEFVEFSKTPEWLCKGIDMWDIVLDKNNQYWVAETFGCIINKI